MEPIFDKLYQFTYKIPGMSLDCHQYLLLRDPAILFSVGSADGTAGRPSTEILIHFPSRMG